MPTPLPLRYDFLDFESVGVDPSDEIWEVAVIGTDVELRELYSFTTLVRPTPAGVAKVTANTFLTQMHTKSGLLTDILGANWETLPTLNNVETYLLELHKRFAQDGHPVSLAGSGVSHYDRKVVESQMPALSSQLTYNSGEIGGTRRMYIEAVGHDIVPPLAEKLHRAEDDIRDDLRHARAFRDLAIAHELRTSVEEPVERALLSLALVDAYTKHDSFTTDSGTFYTEDTAAAVASLLATTDPTDLIFGLADVASTLLCLTAERERCSVDDVVQRLRDGLLEPAAGTPG